MGRSAQPRRARSAATRATTKCLGRVDPFDPTSGFATYQVADVIYGCIPFIGALVTLILMMIAIPDLALWLPAAMR